MDSERPVAATTIVRTRDSSGRSDPVGGFADGGGEVACADVPDDPLHQQPLISGQPSGPHRFGVRRIRQGDTCPVGVRQDRWSWTRGGLTPARVVRSGPTGHEHSIFL